MVVALVVLGALLAGVLITSKNRDGDIEKLDSNDHPLKSLYPLASLIYGVFRRGRKQDIFGSPDILREVYMDEKPEISQKIQGCKCIASILAILGVTCIICFAYAYSREKILVNTTHLKRNEAGMGVKEYDLMMNSSLTRENEIKVRVNEKRLEGDELAKLKEDAAYYIDNHILKEGDKPECVRGDLNLMTGIPGTSISIKWSEDNSWFVGIDGNLKNSELVEPVMVSLRAVLFYYDESWDYEKLITIYPPLLTEEESFLQALDEILKRTDEETQTEEMFELPEKVGDVEVGWEEKDDNGLLMFMFLGLVGACIIIPAMKQDIKKKKKLRNEQMMRDYPDIISKFVMLITAGMTCRGAWGKICADYVRTRDKKKSDRKNHKKSFKYAYEEMLISDKEMQLGMPEIKVYERFGTRCQVPAYNKFGTLLARNIKRGSAGIIEILETESKESIVERRENVRKQGEETGTKLLLPMFGMLILVIAIVVVPAFSSFSL